MALVNLKTKYTDLKWDYDGGVPHFDLKQRKPRFLEDYNKNQQNLFYQNNIGKLLGPLAALTTQYKDKSFGSDQKLNGYSGLPYIKFNYDGTAIIGDTKIKTDNTSLVDFPIRGGNYPSREIDFERIKAFMKSDKGELFVKKQKILQFMNPKTETGLAGAGVVSVSDSLNPTIAENTRTYSSENTLGQVAFQGTGTHVSRIGSPYINANDEFYGTVVGMQNVSNNALTNRLEILRRLKILNVRSTFKTSLETAQYYLYSKKLGISLNKDLIYNYPGGPNASDKFGSTLVRRAVDTTVQPQIVLSDKSITYDRAMTYDKLHKTSLERAEKKEDVDFRAGTEYYKGVVPSTSGSVVWTSNQTFQKKFNEVTPNAKRTNYTITISKDKLNALEKIVNNDTNYNPYTDEKNPKDFIKFGFECMSNEDAGKSTVLLFRAFLSNGFTDNNTAQLTPFRYFGRGEEFFTYGGFSRSIQFSFKIVAKSRAELKPLYQKLNTLISQVYPDYSAKVVMRAPLIKLTIGDYLYRVPGLIDNITVTADNATPWEINLENSTDVEQLPHVVDVQVSFKPIHSILPKRNANLITQW